MVATDAAAHKIDALVAINYATARSAMIQHWTKRLSVPF
jgi:hypothetical protein